MKYSKLTTAVIILSTIVLSACGDITNPKWQTDQLMRQKLFKECMALLPAGPQSTKYNDWDEVVDQCDDIARWQSRFCVKYCPDGVQKGPFIQPVELDALAKIGDE